MLVLHKSAFQTDLVEKRNQEDGKTKGKSPEMEESRRINEQIIPDLVQEQQKRRDVAASSVLML